MKIRVLETRHFGAMFGAPIFLNEREIEELEACPVCDDATNQRLSAQAEGLQERGLAFSECETCGHGYLSRRPSSNWYQHYYSVEWDSGRTGPAVEEGLVEKSFRFLRKVPGLRRVYRGMRQIFRPTDYTHSLERENLMAMLAGIGNARGMKFLPRDMRLLEIGCGYGGALTIFKELGFQAIGTEASAHRVASCRARGLDVVETSIEDVSSLSTRGPFDFVYSAHVFEHILDVSRLIKQLAPMVADGGYIYIEVPNSSAAEGLLKFLHYPYHCHAFSASSLTRLLERHGFRTVRVQMDVNLHVVACKGIGSFDFPECPPQSSFSRLLRGDGEWTKENGRLRIYFDDVDLRIEHQDSGRVIYQRPRPYAARTPMNDGVPVLGREFLLEIADRSGSLPVHWVHDTPQAPIWMKFQ